MRNLSISYTNMCREFTVCGVGWVRDIVLCWIKGVWTGAVLGIVLKYHSCLLTAVYKWVTFLIFTMHIGKTILSMD